MSDQVSTSTLLVMSANCKQLTEWRVSKRPLLDDFAQYQTTVSDSPPTETVAQTCATLRAQVSELAANQAPDIKANGIPPIWPTTAASCRPMLMPPSTD